jgi:hypothetical protein
MIQCYAPTAVADDDERQEFYVQLLKKHKKKDIFILGEDLNAKVGQDNVGLEHIMGRHGLGKRNEKDNFLWISVLATIWSLAEQYFCIRIVTK